MKYINIKECNCNNPEKVVSKFFEKIIYCKKCLGYIEEKNVDEI